MSYREYMLQRPIRIWDLSPCVGGYNTLNLSLTALTIEIMLQPRIAVGHHVCAIVRQWVESSRNFPLIRHPIMVTVNARSARVKHRPAAYFRWVRNVSSFHLGIVVARSVLQNARNDP